LHSRITLAEINDSLFSRAANVIINNLPEMKKGLLEALDLVFTPKQIASQFVLAVALETSMVGKHGVYLVWFILLSLLVLIVVLGFLLCFTGHRKSNMVHLPINCRQCLDSFTSYSPASSATANV
jgi:hypothetical protein